MKREATVFLTIGPPRYNMQTERQMGREKV